jgi:16S rRNA (cytosine1402-N4)-methyltransferase
MSEQTQNPTHVSVLYNESLDALNLAAGKTIIDGTFGAGGHSSGIAEKIGKKGRLISFDQDAEVFTKPVVEKIRSHTNFTPVNANFRTMYEACRELDIESVDGVLLDLGLSSTQLEHSGRGFSFLREEPLAMTFNDKPETALVTARDIVNYWQQENLATIFKGFGDEPFSGRIARVICEEREKKPIETTTELVEIIRMAIPGKFAGGGRTHFATRVFQALRMAANDELGSAADGMRGAVQLLAPGGRLAVISFHSIEDRLVKHTLKELVDEGLVALVNKKPIEAGEEELKHNPRARSAKLRVVEKL